MEKAGSVITRFGFIIFIVAAVAVIGGLLVLVLVDDMTALAGLGAAFYGFIAGIAGLVIAGIGGALRMAAD